MRPIEKSITGIVYASIRFESIETMFATIEDISFVTKEKTSLFVTI